MGEIHEGGAIGGENLIALCISNGRGFIVAHGLTKTGYSGGSLDTSGAGMCRAGSRKPENASIL